MSGERLYGGLSAEQRLDGRRRRLLDAGLETFGTAGYDATTVKVVCRQAGLTERYFYEHFGDRLELLVAVYDEVVTLVAGGVLVAIADAPATLEDKSRAGLQAFLGALAEDPRKARVQLIEVVGRSPQLERRRHDDKHAFADLLTYTAVAFGPDRGDVDPLDRRVAARGLVGATHELAIDFMDGALDVPLNRLVEDLVQMYLAVAGSVRPAEVR